MRTPILELKDVTFQYDAQATPTLKNLNLRIMPGEKVLIAGPSGSGKSTLSRLMNGLIPHAFPGALTGKFLINGQDATSLDIFDRSLTIGTVLQDSDAQFVGLSVAEDLAFALENDEVAHVPMLAKVRQWAEELKLTDLLGLAPQVLSGGQKQRVAMAGVLIDDAPVLLFDEPLASLDPASGQRMMTLLSRLQAEQNLTVIMIEHRLEDVIRHQGDRIIVLVDGEIVADDTPAHLLQRGTLDEFGLAVPTYIRLLEAAGVNLTTVTNITDPKTLQGPDVVAKINAWQEKLPMTITEKTSDPLLTIEGLQFGYAGKSLFERLSVTVYQGELLALVGKNGSGKSTLSQLIAGFIQPTSGRLTLRSDLDLSTLSIKERAAHIGYVAQNPNQMITQSIVFDEVASGLRLRGWSEEQIEPKVNELLMLAGLYGMRNWPVTVLSYGQKKRLTMIAVLALEPELLILDEPTAGQDLAHATSMMNFVRALNERLGTTIVLITHDMALMLGVAKRTLVLVDGELVADTTPAALLTTPSLVEQADLRVTSIYELADNLGLVDPEQLTAAVSRWTGGR